MPPIVEENGCEDALDFFLRLGREREEVQQKLTAIHEKHEKESRKTHPETLWEVGDRVWVRNLPKGEDRHLTNWPAFGRDHMRSSKLWAGVDTVWRLPRDLKFWG